MRVQHLLSVGALVLFMCFAPQTSYAQPKEELAAKAATLVLSVTAQAGGMFKGMKSQLSQAMPQMLDTMIPEIAKSKGVDPNLVKKQLEAQAPVLQALSEKMFDAITPAFEVAMKEMSQDPELLALYKRMFLERFTEQEIKQTIAFYETPVAKKMMTEVVEYSGPIAAVSMRIMNKHLLPIMPKLVEQQQQELKALVETAANSTKKN